MGTNKKLVSNLTDQNRRLIRGIAKFSEFKLEKFWTRPFKISRAGEQNESRNAEVFEFLRARDGHGKLTLFRVAVNCEMRTILRI
jgi:hypothetical protein